LKLFFNESADAPVEVFSAIGQNLLGERVHAACRFSRAHRTHNGDAGEKASFRADQPARRFRGPLLAGVMYLAYYERKFCPLPEDRIRRQFARPNLAACLEGEHVDAGSRIE